MYCDRNMLTTVKILYNELVVKVRECALNININVNQIQI